MKFIVFTGLSGTGKSTLAEAVGKKLSIPVFAKDWLEAALIRSELVSSHEDQWLGSAGYQLLTALAERQMMLNQSVALDSVASTQSIRDRWKELSDQYNARWILIECICSDEAVHRSRVLQRERKIPGWYELQWSDIQKVKEYFLPWAEERLVLDMMDPLEQNVSRALAYCE